MDIFIFIYAVEHRESGCALAPGSSPGPVINGSKFLPPGNQQLARVMGWMAERCSRGYRGNTQRTRP